MADPAYQRIPESEDIDDNAPLLPLGADDGRPIVTIPCSTSPLLNPALNHVNEWGIVCLLLQHVSSTFTDACYNFAVFLFLIEIFPTTLVPPSLVGLSMTCMTLLLSGYIGGLVDVIPRLTFLRRAVGCQKVLQAAVYALFILLFGPLRSIAQSALRGKAEPLEVISTWGVLGLIIVASSILKLANTGLTVCVERDWVATIAQGDDALLTRLNTSIRRIDLMTKLCSPLVVSLLTTSAGYTATTFVLLALAVITAVTETLWVGVVYRKFSALSKRPEAYQDVPASHQQEQLTWKERLRKEKEDWQEFAKMPIFASEVVNRYTELTTGSVAISAIYLTTLSYDGTFIAYVKAARGWDDTFVAVMRGVTVLTGLLGTMVMPRLERAIGLERAGAWSIWFEVACLCPSVFSFFYGTGVYGQHGPAWNSILLFGGIALSRIGLWSFDLCQLKELQLALADHRRRNRMTALQLALQSAFDLLKYVLTLAAASPARFKWTALASWGAVICGAVIYAVYLRSVRGHLVHFEWLKKGC